MQTTIILVHGAFAESSSWRGVTARLTPDHRVIAYANPLRGIASDAAGLSELVRSIDGPVVLVGHSYGGTVITALSPDVGSIVGLVYVAAFAPDHGENALGLTGKFPGSTLGETVRSYPLGDGTNDLVVDRDLFPGQFAADVPAADAAVQARTQRPIRDYALGEAQPAETPAWKTLPSWFVFGDADKNIPVEGLRFMAERAGAVSIKEIPGASHSVMVSQPAAVTELITEAVDYLSKQ